MGYSRNLVLHFNNVGGLKGDKNVKIEAADAAISWLPVPVWFFLLKIYLRQAQAEDIIRVIFLDSEISFNHFYMLSSTL